MKSVMSETNLDPARVDGLSADLERECETWDWARTAGLSLLDLRRAVLEWLLARQSPASGSPKPPR
jgi:hypothetical protein